MKKQFVIIGFGRFGLSVAQTLTDLGYEVLAIDSDIDRVQKFVSKVTHVVEADATDPETLNALGIRNFDVAVVAIGHNVQASILATVLLKEMGIKTVVAKAISDLHGRVLEKVGADKVVYPERDMGVRVAHKLVSANVLDEIELSTDFSIQEVLVPRKLKGKTLGKLNLRSHFGISVMAIKRGPEIVVSPGADDVLEEGDILVLLGANVDLVRFEEEYRE